MIKFSGVRKHFGAFTLSDVSFSVSPGDFVALVGPNGSGKTTLLRMLSGLVAPDEGEILLDGKSVSSYETKALASRVAYVDSLQDDAFHLKVFELALLGRWVHLNGRLFENEEDVLAAQGALERTHSLPLAGRNFFDLSAGEKQKVLISVALAQQTNILLVDEPTSHLDLKNQLEVIQLLRRLASEDKTVIAAIHDMNLALQYATRVVLLSGGTLKAAGNPCEVLTKNNLEEVFGVSVHEVKEKGRIYILLNHDN